MEEEIMTSGMPKEKGVIQREPGDKSFDETENSLFVEDLQGTQKFLQGNPSTSTGQSAESDKFKQKNGERVTTVRMDLEEAVDLFTEPDKNQAMYDYEPMLPRTLEDTEENPVNVILGSKDFLKGRDSVIEQKYANQPACENEGGEVTDSLVENMTDVSEQETEPRDQSTLASEVSQASNSSTSLQADIVSIDQSLEVQDDLIATAGKTMQPLQECVASEQSNDNSKSTPTGTCVPTENMNLKQNPEFQGDLPASPGKTMQPLQECVPSEINDDQSKLNPNDTNQSAADGFVSIPGRKSIEHEELKFLLTEQTNEPADISMETNKYEPNFVNTFQSLVLAVSDSQNVERENWEHSLSNEKTDENQTMLTQGNPTDHVQCSSTRRRNVESFSSNGKGEDQLVHDEEQQTKQKDQINAKHLSHVTATAKTSSAQATVIRYSDEDNSPEHHLLKDYAENLPCNLSTEPKRLDGQILHPPVKTPVLTRESIMELDSTDQEKRKFNSNAASNNSNVPCSDEKAAIILRTLLGKRSIENAMTLSDINEAILQGKPISPMMYIIEVESKKNSKPKELEENQADLQGSDGENQIMLWITGSHQLQKYLCWPCLLFGDNVWHIPILWGLGDIVEAANNHQNSEPHMSAFMKLLVHETKLKREKEAQSETDLECKRQNEHLLKLLIEISCSNMDGTPEEHAELLSMACSYKAELQEFIEEKPLTFPVDFVISNLGPIRRAIEQLLKAKMLEEIENVPFVAIIFEDTTEVVDKSLIAVILRYVTDSGIPKERLVKLKKMRMNRTVEDFLKTILSVVQEYQLTEKLVGFTYNGTVISPKEIIIFNITVSRIYPNARFFPYQEHNLKKIITQSLSHLPECREFCYTINELAGFLKNAPNVMKTLIGMKMGLKMQKHQWDFENGFINTMKCHYELIISFFDQVIGREFDWDSETVMHVKYFSHFLRSLKCRVLLMVISAILNAINDLCNAMESKVVIDSWTRLLTEATKTLTNMKHFGLRNILHERNTLIAASECAEVHRSSITPELYKQIFDSTLIAMNHRCNDLEMAFVGPGHIEAASNWGTEHQAVFLKRINFSMDNFFELKNEAKSFFENPFIAEKNLEQSIKHIYDLKIVDSARHLLRFLQLCLTLPTKDAYSSKSSPAVLQLRSYITKNKPLNFFDLMIFMEKDTLSSMQRNEQYYDYVLEYCKKSGK